MPWPNPIRSAMTSLDDCVADVGDGFDWAAPDDEVHTGGATLATHAFVVGLIDERRLGDGVVHMHHRVT